MCNKKQVYGAEYFLIPAPKIMKPIFKKLILLKRGFQKCILLPTCTDTFSFKLEPTEVQDAAKRPNFEFSQLQPSPSPPLMVSENLK